MCLKAVMQDVRCITPHLGKGALSRPRLHSPGVGSLCAASASRTKNCIASSNHSQGDFALPAPIDQRGLRAPLNTQTTSWRPTLRRLDGRHRIADAPLANTGRVCIHLRSVVCFPTREAKTGQSASDPISDASQIKEAAKS